MTHDNLYSFIFRGLLTEQALDKTDRKKLSIFNNDLDSYLVDRLCLTILDRDLVNKARRMAIVYTAISAFENTVRNIVSKTLLEEKGENWWQESVPEKIQKDASIRQTEEAKLRYQASRGGSIINFVDFGDLMSIIQKDGNWEYFEPYLSSIEWGRGIMDILEKSRHIIMHSGELGDKDIERVGMNIRDWISQVGG